MGSHSFFAFDFGESVSSFMFLLLSLKEVSLIMLSAIPRLCFLHILLVFSALVLMFSALPPEKLLVFSALPVMGMSSVSSLTSGRIGSGAGLRENLLPGW